MARMLPVLTILLASLASVTYSQATKSTPADAAAAEERKRVVDKMRSFLADVKLYDVDDDHRQQVPLVDHPVLFFQDVERKNHHGSVWVWGKKGRPRAIIEAYFTGNEQRGDWPGNVMHSMSPTRIVAEGRFGWKWQPSFPAFELQRLTGVTKPADKPLARMQQIKNLATKFNACEYWDPDTQRSELRLLAHPVHEYRDESARVLAGALFAFVHGGSNPEAILLIEAIGTNPEQSEWQFGFVRLGHAELHGYFDGREVWSQAIKRFGNSRSSGFP